jgi:hypothetical protein
MRVDKNSSPKSRTRLCPKFTTKDSHMSLPRLRSHNGPTTLGTSLNSTQSGSTTQETRDLSNLSSSQEQTIRSDTSDYP